MLSNQCNILYAPRLFSVKFKFKNFFDMEVSIYTVKPQNSQYRMLQTKLLEYRINLKSTRYHFYSKTHATNSNESQPLSEELNCIIWRNIYTLYVIEIVYPTHFCHSNFMTDLWAANFGHDQLPESGEVLCKIISNCFISKYIIKADQIHFYHNLKTWTTDRWQKNLDHSEECYSFKVNIKICINSSD